MLGEASDVIIAGDAGLRPRLADEAGCVMRQPQEICRAFQELLLGFRELRESSQGTATLLVYALDLGPKSSGVVPIYKDGVCEPAQHEVQEALGSSQVLGTLPIQGLRPVGIEHDAHASLLLWAMVRVVVVPSSGMRLEDQVSHLVREKGGNDSKSGTIKSLSSGHAPFFVPRP